MGIERGGMALHSRELGSHFTLHLVDLPGYGRSSGFGAMTFEEMTAQVAKTRRTSYLAWLEPAARVASQMALTHPERVQALVTVASSPCFSA